ncbi:MAG: EAL domain-containing protein [Elainellaceae cyanobacterium]
MNVVAALSGCLTALFSLGIYPALAQGSTDLVRVGVYENHPKIFTDDEGEAAGFWVDLLEHIANEEGWSLEYISCEWEQCLQAVEQGQLDLMVDAAYSEERDRRFDFNQEVVLSSWSEIYARSDVSLDSILDLDQKKVAVLKDSIQYDVLAEQAQLFNIKPQFVEVADFQAMFQMLDQGEVDAGVVNRFFGQQVEAQYQVVATNILVYPSRLHFIASDGENAERLAAIDRQLRPLISEADSAYYQALERWLEPKPLFGWKQLRHVLVDLVIYLSIAALVVVVVWNRLLRQEVKRRKRAEAALSESEQRFSNIAANVPGAIFKYVIHPDGSDQVIYMSRGCYELWEVEAETVIQNAKVLWDMVVPDDRAAMYESVMVSAQTMQPWSWQWRIVTPSGQRKWLEAAGRPERSDNGDVTWDTLILDVSDRKHAEAALSESEERLRLVTENMSDLVCLHDSEGRYVYVTPSSRVLLGYDPAELIGHHPEEWVHPDDGDRFRQEFQRVSLESKSVPHTYRIRKKAGDFIWLETLTQPIMDEARQVIHWQTASRDVSDRVRVEHRLKHDALYDGLTGLPNRSLLIERLNLAIKRAKRQPRCQFAVMFLDLDNFKLVNDSLGHSVGDELLRVVANLLPDFIRETDVAARLGGDEFVILLEDLDSIDGAIQVSERILDRLRSPLMVSDREVVISSSIGIVGNAAHHQQAEDLLRDADLAMYRAKHHGRAGYALFDPAMHLQVVRRLHLEQDLRKALDRNEFVLHYQPIVSLETQHIQGFEALIRWNHPKQGLVPPSEFVAIAEETGLIVPIGRWVLNTACHQLVSWQRQFPDAALKISVNLSVQQLHGFLLNHLDNALSQSGLRSDTLILEITESMLIENIEATLELLEQIKRRGVRLSIDDFGTGYSSLSYLHRLPVDALKIDRAFVSPARPDARNQVIAESIVALSNLLELNAIAEGIEQFQQLQWLKTLGCELGQGNFFSAPVPASQATQLLAQSTLAQQARQI